MALFKSIASKIINGVEVLPERQIEMHPLEEAMIREEWAINELKDTLIPPSQQQEQEWLIEHGVEYVREQRALFKEKVKKMTPGLQVLYDKFIGCEKKWNSHIQKCLKHGLEIDTANTEHLEE